MEGVFALLRAILLQWCSYILTFSFFSQSISSDWFLFCCKTCQCVISVCVCQCVCQCVLSVSQCVCQCVVMRMFVMWSADSQLNSFHQSEQLNRNSVSLFSLISFITSLLTLTSISLKHYSALISFPMKPLFHVCCCSIIQQSCISNVTFINLIFNFVFISLICKMSNFISNFSRSKVNKWMNDLNSRDLFHFC